MIRRRPDNTYEYHIVSDKSYLEPRSEARTLSQLRIDINELRNIHASGFEIRTPGEYHGEVVAFPASLNLIYDSRATYIDAALREDMEDIAWRQGVNLMFMSP